MVANMLAAFAAISVVVAVRNDSVPWLVASITAAVCSCLFVVVSVRAEQARDAL